MRRGQKGCPLETLDQRTSTRVSLGGFPNVYYPAFYAQADIRQAMEKHEQLEAIFGWLGYDYSDDYWAYVSPRLQNVRLRRSEDLPQLAKVMGQVLGNAQLPK